MSRLELYFHLVWATQHRQPLLTVPKEEAVFRCIIKLMEPMPYAILALNGMPDHVHLLIQTGSQVDVSALMKKLKAVSSTMVNDMTDHVERFRWQEGYYAATITPSHMPRVRAYILNQKQHHSDGTARPSFEQTGEEAISEHSGDLII